MLTVSSPTRVESLDDGVMSLDDGVMSLDDSLRLMSTDDEVVNLSPETRDELGVTPLAAATPAPAGLTDDLVSEPFRFFFFLPGTSKQTKPNSISIATFHVNLGWPTAS